MKKAKEFLTDYLNKQPAHIKIQFTHLSNEADNALAEAMIEFAKAHVKAAGQQIGELVNQELYDTNHVDKIVSSAYPLSNIE